MFGLPVEMITMLGSSVLGGVMSIWGQSIKANKQSKKCSLHVASSKWMLLKRRGNMRMKAFNGREELLH